MNEEDEDDEKLSQMGLVVFLLFAVLFLGTVLFLAIFNM